MNNNFYLELSDEQREYFDLYKSNGEYQLKPFFTDKINTMLADGTIEDSWKPAIEILDQIVSKRPLEEESTLYRVTSEEVFMKYTEGDDMTYPSYMSTSTDQDAVKKHYSTISPSTEAVLLQILVPKGYPCAPFEHDHTSGFEQEVLLGRDTKFKVTSCGVYTDEREITEHTERDIALYLTKLTILNITLLPNTDK